MITCSAMADKSPGRAWILSLRFDEAGSPGEVPAGLRPGRQAACPGSPGHLSAGVGTPGSPRARFAVGMRLGGAALR